MVLCYLHHSFHLGPLLWPSTNNCSSEGQHLSPKPSGICHQTYGTSHLSSAKPIYIQSMTFVGTPLFLPWFFRHWLWSSVIWPKPKGSLAMIRINDNMFHFKDGHWSFIYEPLKQCLGYKSEPTGCTPSTRLNKNASSRNCTVLIPCFSRSLAPSCALL